MELSSASSASLSGALSLGTSVLIEGQRAAFDFKQRPTDFVVEEIPGCEPVGSGDYLHAELWKVGLGTPEAIQRVADALSIDASSIGYAGLKDAHASTTQRVSLANLEQRLLQPLRLDGLQLTPIGTHHESIARGMHAGNRFRIALRNVAASAVPSIARGLQTLVERGAPNMFGAQRFGNRGNNGAIGLDLLSGRFAKAVERICGHASDVDTGAVRSARAAFDAGDLKAAARTFPRDFRVEARLAKSLDENPTDPERALRVLSKPRRRFYLAAAQSLLFNRFVERRLPDLTTLLRGDVVRRVDPPATFVVDDVVVEQRRSDAREIVATGPLFGRKLRRSAHAARALELELLEDCGLSEDAFAARGVNRCIGSRRELLVHPREAACGEFRVDENGPLVELSFALPPGAFATSVLRQLRL